MSDIKGKIILWLVLIAISAGGGAWAARSYYQPRLESAQSALQRLAGAVEEQGREAQAQLAMLTAQRDKAQAKLNAATTAQETTDEKAQTQIADLAAQSRSQPIRVRLSRKNPGSGSSGGSAQAKSAEGTGSSAGDTAQDYGLLPDGNAQSLIGMMEEAEQINAAYASCRNTLMTWAALGPWQ